MGVSQNGWSTITGAQLDRSPIPGTNVVPLPGLRAGDVATVLLHVGKLFNERVARVKNPGCWGYNAPTAIPGSYIISNHGSGTAIDLNAPSFPVKLRRMSAAQRNACRQIVKELGGVVRWGGDYTTVVDEMHFEINANAAQVSALANKIKQTGDVEMLTNKNHLDVLFAQFVNRKPTTAEYKDYLSKTYDYALTKLHPARIDLGDVITESAALEKALARKPAEYVEVTDKLFKKK